MSPSSHPEDEHRSARNDRLPASATRAAAMSAENLPTILVVDDTPENLAVLAGLLQPYYRVLVATDGRRALRIACAQPKPDLILLDVMMPGMDGYEVFDHLRAASASRDIPVVFVSAMDNTDAELRGLRIGAVDYITKPLIAPIVLARVHNQLELKQARDLLADQNSLLESEVSRRTAENEAIQEASVRALAHLAEARDPETGNHILRTQGYVRELATRLRAYHAFAPVLTEQDVRTLVRSAPLHDIGKVGVPDAILRKPGPLTRDEWAVMRSHTWLGSDAIERAEGGSSARLPFLTVAREIARWHHERWDGGGYPDGLHGEQIPVSARIMAIADVFDALVSPRVYKPAFGFEVAREQIAAGRGTHFDPVMTDAFLDGFDAFRAIAEALRDGIPPVAASASPCPGGTVADAEASRTDPREPPAAVDDGGYCSAGVCGASADD